MIVTKVEFNNFKPYYKINSIDLATDNDRNIILIGGRNGQGKTSFLIGLVWCLYGSKISEVDDSFKKEIKHNYNLFLNESLNRTAKSEGVSLFSVRINFMNVSDFYTNVEISRSFNFDNGKEVFKIFSNGVEELLDDDEKIAFVEDYLVPIQAAKFVFFDAEKIAEIADMEAKRQGNFMNDALNKILGLDLYENLKNDLELYEKNIRQSCAGENDAEKLKLDTKQIEINLGKINSKSRELGDIEDDLKNIKTKITEFDDFLIKQNLNPYNLNIKDLKTEKDELVAKKTELNQKMTEFVESIPFTMVASQIEQIMKHLDVEVQLENEQRYNEDFQKKGNDFLDRLFNKGPFPDDGDLSIDLKYFYNQKAKRLLEQFKESKTNDYLPFKHNLQENEIEHINTAFDHINTDSGEFFKGIISELNQIENRITEIDIKINKIEGEANSGLLVDYKDKKENLEVKREKLLANKSRLEVEKEQLYQNNLKIQKNIDSITRQINVFNDKRDKIAGVQKYIKVLNEFIKEQKEIKRHSLESSTLKHIKEVMHKELIENVRIDLLPENAGLLIKILNRNNKELMQSSLSKGEQQVLISCLLKAILDETVKEYPVFIDTPLARLDIEHKERLLRYYYPGLSRQVVIFSTDDEVTSQRLKLIENNVKQTYLLKNINDATIITKEYF